MERTRVWRGRVKPEARDDHERFVGWLQSAEGTSQLARSLLTGYTLAQQGDELTVVMAAEEPPPIIRFLRNPKLWPDFWEYSSAGADAGDVPEDAVRVRWHKS